LEVRAPWKAIKEDREAAGATLYHAAEALRIVGVLLHAVMPDKCGELLSRLGRPSEPADFASSTRWGILQAGSPVHSGAPLFPRFELEKE
jgi:methionyl-tRNA synthetase